MLHSTLSHSQIKMRFHSNQACIKDQLTNPTHIAHRWLTNQLVRPRQATVQAIVPWVHDWRRCGIKGRELHVQPSVSIATPVHSFAHVTHTCTHTHLHTHTHTHTQYNPYARVIESVIVNALERYFPNTHSQSLWKRTYVYLSSLPC